MSTNLFTQSKTPSPPSPPWPCFPTFFPSFLPATWPSPLGTFLSQGLCTGYLLGLDYLLPDICQLPPTPPPSLPAHVPSPGRPPLTPSPSPIYNNHKPPLLLSFSTLHSLPWDIPLAYLVSCLALPPKCQLPQGGPLSLLFSPDSTAPPHPCPWHPAVAPEVFVKWNEGQTGPQCEGGLRGPREGRRGRWREVTGGGGSKRPSRRILESRGHCEENEPAWSPSYSWGGIKCSSSFASCCSLTCFHRGEVVAGG